MSCAFITGSTDGLGYAAARTMIEKGHQVVLHARSRDRANAIEDLAPQSAGIVIGDLSSSVETHKVAEQVNAIGRMGVANIGIIVNTKNKRRRSVRFSLPGSTSDRAHRIDPCAAVLVLFQRVAKWSPRRLRKSLIQLPLGSEVIDNEKRARRHLAE